jgi:hypothetical protein
MSSLFLVTFTDRRARYAIQVRVSVDRAEDAPGAAWIVLRGLIADPRVVESVLLTAVNLE